MNPQQFIDELKLDLHKLFSRKLIINEDYNLRYVHRPDGTVIYPADGTMVSTITYETNKNDGDILDSDYEENTKQLDQVEQEVQTSIEPVIMKLLTEFNLTINKHSSDNNNSVMYNLPNGLSIMYTATDYYYIFTVHYFPM